MFKSVHQPSRISNWLCHKILRLRPKRGTECARQLAPGIRDSLQSAHESCSSRKVVLRWWYRHVYCIVNLVVSSDSVGESVGFQLGEQRYLPLAPQPRWPQPVPMTIARGSCLSMQGIGQTQEMDMSIRISTSYNRLIHTLHKFDVDKPTKEMLDHFGRLRWHVWVTMAFYWACCPDTWYEFR